MFDQAKIWERRRTAVSGFQPHVCTITLRLQNALASHEKKYKLKNISHSIDKYLSDICEKYKCDTYFPFNFEEKFNLRNIDFYSVNDMFDNNKKSVSMEIQHYVKK